ncbi:MAG: pseudouridine synthase [Chloroflexi bacterium]|nr:pseudouridine synthase [Chloroflexota bacterium]
MTTLAFYKPYGVLTKFTDHEGRATLADYITLPDVYPAGRLDKDSEGLLLLTDDGGLAHLITDPQHKLWKTYWAQVERVPPEMALVQLARGVEIKGGLTRPAQARLLPEELDVPPRVPPIRYRKSVPTAWIELRLREGRNRQVRRMTAAVGHPTLRLLRVQIGPISLGGLQPGEWREVSQEDVNALRGLVG